MVLNRDYTRKALLAAMLSLFLIVAITVSIAVNAEGIKIDYPSFYRAAAVLPGGSLTVKVNGITGNENLTLYLADASNIYRVQVNVSGEEEGGVLLKAKLPDNIKPSLYDIILEVNGKTVSSPRAVRVFESWPSVLRIAHFTDTHVGLINSNGVPADVYLAGELALAQLLGADVIFGTGDLVDVGGNIHQYADFIKYIDSTPLPSILLPGNHEYSGDAALDNWHKLMGESFYVDRWGPYLFVAIDSGAEGAITPYELHWLEKVLEENKDAKIKILGFHHPIFGTKYVAKVTGSYKNIDALIPHMYSSWAGIPETTAKILELIEKYNVTAVFNGHVHADGLVLYNGKTWFITTTAAGGPVRPGDWHGIRIVDIFLNGTVKIYPCYNCKLWSDHAALNAEKARGALLETAKAIAYYVNLKNYPELQEYAKGENITFGIRLPTSKVPANSTLYVVGTPKPLAKKFEENKYVAEAYVVLPKTPNIDIRLVLSPIKDETPPTIKIYSISPKKPIAGKSRLDVTVKAEDIGWGLMDVKIEYKLPNGQIKEATLYPMGSGYYKARLPVLKQPYVEVRGVAIDIAGYNSTTGWVKVQYAQPTQSTTTTKTTTTTSRTTTTSLTTTTTTTKTTTTTTQTTTSTPTETTTTTVTTTTKAGTSPAVYGGVIAAVIVIAIAAALMVRKK